MPGQYALLKALGSSYFQTIIEECQCFHNQEGHVYCVSYALGPV